MKLYAHQEKIISEDPKKTGLFLGTGSGKTRTALFLARGSTLVICPKTQKEDRNWEREWSKIVADRSKKASDFPRITKLVVVSKEEFRRDWAKLPFFDTVIVDEAHTCLGVTPNVRFVKRKAIPKTSQLFEALVAYLLRVKPQRFYLCTATIIRSPMTVWGAGRLLGRDWDFYDFRNTYYIRLPMPGREVWQAKTDSATKDRLAEVVRSLGYIGRLDDFFDVPDQNFKTFHVELTDKQKRRIKDMTTEYPEPLVRCGKIHQIENGVLSGDEFNAPEYFDNAKIEKILDLALEFPRMVIFARYKAQIHQLEIELSKQYKVLILNGDTKNRGDLIKAANNMKDCIFIAQCQISAGWELPDFPVMVFASRNYSFVDYSQALGRIQRANNIKKNLYINLVVEGGIDEALDKCIENKQDFDERIYFKNLNR